MSEIKDTTNKSAETHDTFDETALEQGFVPPTSENKQSEGAVLRKNKALSIRSKQYDIDGDGELDEIEKAMRDMDASNKGHLSNEKVYLILQEQMRTQKELFNMKRLLLVLSAFTMVLALSNLGTAFAAARLAKDTQLDAQGAMVNKNNPDDVVGVRIENKIFDVISAGERRARRLALGQYIEEGDLANAISGYLSYTDATNLYARCENSQNAYMHYKCGDVIDTLPICGTGEAHNVGGSGPWTTWTYLSGDVTIGRCKSGDEDCPVTFDENRFPCGSGGDMMYVSPPVCQRKNGGSSTCTQCDQNDSSSCGSGEECVIPNGSICKV